jgi:hypothetical protein
MLKLAVLGLTATTNMLLIGGGAFVGGALALKGYQKMTEPKAPVAPVQPNVVVPAH